MNFKKFNDFFAPLRESGPAVSAADDQKLGLRGAGDDLASAGTQDHDILDPNAEAAGDVDAGLGAADAVFGHEGLTAGIGKGRLVDVQTEAVAEAVAEVVPEAGFRDDRSCGAVDFASGDAGPAGGDAGKLGLQDGVIDLFHLIRRLAERDGAGHVAAVSVLQAAEVHGDEVPRLKHGIARDAVGLAGVLTGDDDGIKGIALAAVA